MVQNYISRVGHATVCVSAHFYVKGFSYDHICGQAKAYQKENTDGFHTTVSIDDVYVPWFGKSSPLKYFRRWCDKMKIKCTKYFHR